MPQGETREARAARWQIEHERRAALVADCKTWQERALRLHAAGELSDFMLDALGIERRDGSGGVDLQTRGQAPARPLSRR